MFLGSKNDGRTWIKTHKGGLQWVRYHRFFFTSMESHHENHLIYSDPDDNRMVLMENSPAKHI